MKNGALSLLSIRPIGRPQAAIVGGDTYGQRQARAFRRPAVETRRRLRWGFAAALRRSELIALRLEGPRGGARQAFDVHPADPIPARKGRGIPIAVPRGNWLPLAVTPQAWLAVRLLSHAWIAATRAGRLSTLARGVKR